MVPAAPRYHPSILRAVRELDDPAQPIAETCRRVGAAAWSAGLVRPTYPHLRRLVHAERRRKRTETARRQAARAVLEDAFFRWMNGRLVDPDLVLDRLRDARMLEPRS
ncbi:MAG TPA: hypothetical protein VK874_06790 [Gaiellaceae bacterium]|nr:hypothetical protein [Gaiellaceae bacterium]